MPDFLKRLIKYFSLAVLVLPFKNGSKVQQRSQQESPGIQPAAETDQKPTEVLGITDEPLPEMAASEYGQFFVNETKGIVVDGQRNQLIPLLYDDASKPHLTEILSVFHPELDQNSVESYLNNYKMLVGADVDYYLETVRKGSWGTTVLSVDETGDIHFRTISLRQFLVQFGYEETREGAVQELIQEEFFQAHQYDSVVAELYNSGYLYRAGIKTPSEVVQAVSVKNMRAFLELFPQQKYLLDTGYGRNSYNFYIGSELFEGPSSAGNTINPAYEKLVYFIEDDLGIQTTPKSFLDPDEVIRINDAFRNKYKQHYLDLGFTEEQIQIWNLVGMKRHNAAHPENSLDMRAVLELPTNE